MLRKNLYGPMTATLLVLLMCITSSCATKSIMKDFTTCRPAEYVDSACNIAYKHADGKEILLDIYSLKGDTTSKRPVVIYIHGGSWTGGDKSWIHFTSRQAVADAFVKENYVVVSVNYRLAEGKKYDFQTELSDCRDAIKWVRRNAKQYHADPDKIGLWGTSAGAHLSLICGYLPTDSTDMRFVIDFYGPANLHKMFRTDLSPIGLGAARAVMPKLYHERQVLMKIFPRNFCDVYSPVNIADRNSTPTLILHGKKDKLVGISQAYELNRVLTDYGAYHKMFVYPKLAHGFTQPTQQELSDMVKQSVDFAKECFR